MVLVLQQALASQCQVLPVPLAEVQSQAAGLRAISEEVQLQPLPGEGLVTLKRGGGGLALASAVAARAELVDELEWWRLGVLVVERAEARHSVWEVLPAGEARLGLHAEGDQVLLSGVAEAEPEDADLVMVVDVEVAEDIVAPGLQE